MKTGIGVRLSPDWVFDLYRIWCSMLSGFYMLREESLKFKKDRFEAWRKLMEEKGRQRESQTKLKIQFQREQLLFKEKARGVLSLDCKIHLFPF